LLGWRIRHVGGTDVVVPFQAENATGEQKEPAGAPARPSGVHKVTRVIVASCLLLGFVVACSTIPSGSASHPPATGQASMAPSSAPPSSASTPAPSAPVTPPTSTAPATVPSPRQVTQVTSAAQAAAVVFESNPLFGSVSQPIAGVIGQSSSYQASQSGDGFNVSVTLGSGDCPAGCINEHTWNYSVSGDGRVTLVNEQGDPFEAPTENVTPDPATVSVHLVAGPVCPVERNPPDPSCAPRPVPGATVVLHDPSGAEVGQASADSTGTATFSVPGGAYYLEAAGVQGLMRLPDPQAFSVLGGHSVSVVMEYDTGIR
jgi:hypothetical protein